MKRALFCVAVLLFLASHVAAIQLDYQEYEDYSEYSNCTLVGGTGGYCQWRGNATAGNSYMEIVSGTQGKDAYVMYATPLQTTYAAGTLLSTCTAFGASKIMMFDSAISSLGSWNMNTVGRYELVVNDGVASLYKNGILVSSQAVISNPVYVGFGAYSFTPSANGCGNWDDIIYGADETKEILGMPADAKYYLKKDMVNPASSGLFNASTGIVVYSNYLPVSFSRSNLSGFSLSNNESIYLINAQTGTVYATLYTGADINSYSASSPFASTKSFNIGDALVSGGAPYGWYQIKINNTLSDRIAYIANGANINFDKSGYSIGDEATITYLVDSLYWLPGEYTYRIDIVDAYGTVHDTQNIATSSGTVTYTWNSDTDTQGVYYAEIIADRISDGEDILLNYDYATLTAYFGFNGYVNAAQTALPIEAANVTYAQGDTVETDSSGFDGNYSASGFLTGIAIWANVSADGFENQNFTFTVQNGHTITRNITLNETSPVYTGLGIGGVARDGIFTPNNSITNGYGRPISSPVCYLLNTTHSESYTTTGNNAGGYLFDETTSAFLTTGRVYDLWCQRSGYSNSPNYTVVV